MTNTTEITNIITNVLANPAWCLVDHSSFRSQLITDHRSQLITFLAGEMTFKEFVHEMHPEEEAASSENESRHNFFLTRTVFV